MRRYYPTPFTTSLDVSGSIGFPNVALVKFTGSIEVSSGSFPNSVLVNVSESSNFPFTGSAAITGSLDLIGSFTSSGDISSSGEIFGSTGSFSIIQGGTF